MRFACDACLTRYTLADEKVRGRVLKIRCKTCGKVMIVKDPAIAEPHEPSFGEQATRALDPAEAMRLAQSANPVADDADSWENQPTRSMPAAEAMRLALSTGPQAPIEWFAMRKGQQLGPMSVTELERQLAAGDLGPRSYVWREGMADWQRMESVEELAALAAAAAGHFVPTPGPLPAPAPAPTPSASQLDAESLFDLPPAQGEPTPAAAPAPRQAPVIEAAPQAAPVARQGGPAGRSGEDSGGGAWALQQGGTRPSTPAVEAAGRGRGRMLELVAAGVILAVVIAAGAYFLLPAGAAVQDVGAAPAAVPPANGLVRIGELPTAGYPPLGPVALRKALDTRIDGYQRCLTDHAQAGARPRRLVVRAVVAPSGAVTTASAEGGGPLGVCLADRTRDIRFPAFQGAPIQVSVPLELPAK